jgi:hypothetical protein
MKNITLAMVAVLAAVVMLSAVLAVAPMQQASASIDINGGDSEVKTGDNKVIIKQRNECEEVEDDSCTNDLMGTITQNTGEDDFPPGPP